MEKEISQDTFKRNVFDHHDSGVVLLFALLVPFVVSYLMSTAADLIASNNTDLTSKMITSSIVFNIIQAVLLLASYVGVWFFYCKYNKIPYSAVSLKPKQSWKDYLLVIGLAFVLVFGMQYLVQAFDSVLSWIGYPIEEGLGSSDPTNVGEYFYALFAMGLVPAIGEELIFRGVVLNGMRQRFSTTKAVLISATLFMLFHGNLQQLIYPFVLGIVLGFVFARTGSLMLSMILHLANNFIVITCTFIQNMTGFSFGLPFSWWMVLVAIACAAATFGICFIVDKFRFKNKDKEEITPTEERISRYFIISIAVCFALFVLSIGLQFISE